MEIEEKEAALIQAGEKLGQIMAKLGLEEKAILRKLKDAVENHAKEQEKKGIPVDRSSLYATAIILDDELMAMDEMVIAAKEYIDADHAYIKALKDK